MKLGIQVGLGPGHIVSDGNPAPLPQKGHSPQFSAHVRCDQMAVWIKMPLGKEVGLGSGDFVLDGDPAPPPKKGHSPQLSAHVYCNQTAGRIKMPLGTEVGLGAGHHIVLDGNPAPPRKRGTAAPPSFRRMSIVVTVANLLLSSYWMSAISETWGMLRNSSCNRQQIADLKHVKKQKENVVVNNFNLWQKRLQSITL